MLERIKRRRTPPPETPLRTFERRQYALMWAHRSTCQIESAGHKPNYMQVLKFAIPQQTNGEGTVITSIEVRDHTDELGTVGIYTLTDIDGQVSEVFDHHADRMRGALLPFEYPGLSGNGTEIPVMELTPSRILFVGMWCFSVAPIENLATREPCGENPWGPFLRAAFASVAEDEGHRDG